MNKCPKDQSDIIYYYLQCKQKMCFCCFKKNEENNLHQNHNIINILKEMPTLYQLNNLKERTFDSLIKSLDEWNIELNNKIKK